MIYGRRWSVLAMGGLLVAMLALVLGVASTPMTALADGGGSTSDPLEGGNDTTGSPGSVGEPIDDPDTTESLTTWDMLLYSIAAIL